MMDFLCNAYANDSDEEDAPKPQPPPQLPTSSKRPKLDPQITQSNPGGLSLTRQTRYQTPQNEAPIIPGRYISKRERSASLNASSLSRTQEHDVISTSLVRGSLSDAGIRSDVFSILKNKAKSIEQRSIQIAEKMSVALSGHTKAVNALHWSPTHPHLLASAGMDNSVCIWNPWTVTDQKMSRRFSFHNAAVKDVKWSLQGSSILSCGFDCCSRLVDVEKGTETQVFKDDQTVGVVKFHGENVNLFLSGGSQGHIRLWDIRTGKAVHEYTRGREPVLDVEFSRNGKQIIASNDISRTNVSENSIIVWDIARQVPLSNQVYVEAYTCPCVRIHPYDSVFVAQSNGNYIAIFSSSPPFKLNKYMRYEGHGVSGFPIKCNFSTDGERLISGSSDGFIYTYNYRSSQLVRKIKAHEQACVDIAVHPILPNVVASCSWSGQVSIFE